METKHSAENKARLEIGFGRANITPDYPMCLAGSASKRLTEEVLDPIFLTCIAVRQGEDRFLLITMDLVGAYEEYSAPLRTHISKVTGIAEDHVILNATHTHSSVNARDGEGIGVPEYRKSLAVWGENAAKEALEDLALSELWYGNAQTSGMVWVRHYKMSDGTFAGANYGSFKTDIVGHVSEADPEMQVLKFVREGKKDVVLMNFPAHATLNKEKAVSADFPGPARQYVEEKTGALVAYFIAGAGDQVPSSRIPEEQFSEDYRVYGAEVGRITVECMEHLTCAESTELRYAHRTFVGKSNKTDLHRSGEALAVKAIWDQVGGRGTKEGKAAAKEHGFCSVYEVTAILNRMRFEDTRSLELKTFAIGNVALILAPYEMFGASAMTIKKNSPYDMTFVITCSQNHIGYLPSELGWQIRCYEAQITRFEKGTAEKLAEEYVDILNEMKRS